MMKKHSILRGLLSALVVVHVVKIFMSSGSFLRPRSKFDESYGKLDEACISKHIWYMWTSAPHRSAGRATVSFSSDMHWIPDVGVNYLGVEVPEAELAGRSSAFLHWPNQLPDKWCIQLVRKSLCWHVHCQFHKSVWSAQAIPWYGAGACGRRMRGHLPDERAWARWRRQLFAKMLFRARFVARSQRAIAGWAVGVCRQDFKNSFPDTTPAALAFVCAPKTD